MENKAQEEEQKLQDKFMASLDLKAEEKANSKGHNRDTSPSGKSSFKKRKVKNSSTKHF